jgi:predicted nucleotidyltransferase
VIDITRSKPKDRDFIETVEGYLFCLVGYLHPPDGYTAYMKYVPSSDGKWEKNGVRYVRSIPYYQVSQVENTYGFLKENHPEYILECPVRNIEVSWVPKNLVQKYYKPKEKLDEIKSRGPNDPLEEKLLSLTSIVENAAGIHGSLGVTGSILTGTQNPSFSDIDITVYGLSESYKLRKALLKLKEGSELIKGVTEQEKEEWILNRLGKYPLDANDLMNMAEKRWNYGFFDDTYFSIHPTRNDEEITEKYGDNTYHRIGEVSGTAVVSYAEKSIYLPAIYELTKVKSDSYIDEVNEIVSFEAIYGNLFENGDKIEFKGILEEIKGKTPHYRIIIGGAGYPHGYIKWSNYSG